MRLYDTHKRTIIMKRLKIFIVAIMATIALASCESYPEGVPSFYSSEYRIINTWQVAHTYLNGVEIDSTEYIGYAPRTFYYMYADHVMSLTGIRNGQLRQSSFATLHSGPQGEDHLVRLHLLREALCLHRRHHAAVAQGVLHRV